MQQKSVIEQEWCELARQEVQILAEIQEIDDLIRNPLKQSEIRQGHEQRQKLIRQRQKLKQDLKKCQEYLALDHDVEKTLQEFADLEAKFADASKRLSKVKKLKKEGTQYIVDQGIKKEISLQKEICRRGKHKEKQLKKLKVLSQNQTQNYHQYVDDAFPDGGVPLLWFICVLVFKVLRLKRSSRSRAVARLFLKTLERKSDQIKGAIAEMKERETKALAALKSLRHLLQHQLHTHREHEREWATRNREHLDYYLSAKPEQRIPIVSLFRSRHPKADISGLLPVQENVCSDQPKHLQRSRKNHVSTETKTSEDSVWINRVNWEFILCASSGSATEQGFTEPLSVAAEEMVAEVLKKENISVDAKYVCQSLARILDMPLQKRRRLKVSQSAHPRGWKILRLPGNNRLFLDINEQTRRIHFLVRPRDRAYR